ncbi:MAG: SRPBCC domain-containing protein [Bacteroidota bacterium]
MNTAGKHIIGVTITVNASIEKVWKLWTTAEDIRLWNNLSDEWHVPKAENDLRKGGQFLYVMGLKDESFSFDFTGTYDEIIPHGLIAYTLNDKRVAAITFTGSNPVQITEDFEPNSTDDIEMQRSFCTAVLQSFKKYVESEM